MSPPALNALTLGSLNPRPARLWRCADCSAICWAYLSAAPAYSGVVFAGTQAQKQCWCGFEMTANSLLPATDCALACPGDATQKCGGPCLSTVSKIDCRGLGWTLVGLILGGGAAYLAVGAGIRHRQGQRGAALLPHRAQWLALHALALDGVAFARSGGGRAAGRQRGGQGEEGRGDERAEKAGKRERKQKQETSETSKERKRKGKRRTEDRTEPLLADAGAGTAEPQTGGADGDVAKSSSAGGGGRWIHVPS